MPAESSTTLRRAEQSHGSTSAEEPGSHAQLSSAVVLNRAAEDLMCLVDEAGLDRERFDESKPRPPGGADVRSGDAARAPQVLEEGGATFGSSPAPSLPCAGAVNGAEAR